MKSFVIFAIVVTVIYVIYYTVIIVQDLYGKPKDEKSQGESFDVSDMTDEEESIAVMSLTSNDSPCDFSSLGFPYRSCTMMTV